jgi:hypothetical protein
MTRVPMQEPTAAQIYTTSPLAMGGFVSSYLVSSPESSQTRECVGRLSLATLASQLVFSRLLLLNAADDDL